MSARRAMVEAQSATQPPSSLRDEIDLSVARRALSSGARRGYQEVESRNPRRALVAPETPVYRAAPESPGAARVDFSPAASSGGRGVRRAVGQATVSLARQSSLTGAQLPNRPRRALDEPVAFELAVVEEDPLDDQPTVKLKAFRAPKKGRKLRKSLVTALSLVAVVGSVTGGMAARMAYAGIDAVSVNTAPQEMTEQEDLSRNASRALIEEPSDSVADTTAAAQSVADQVPEPTLAQQVDIAGTIAPGQLPPASVDQAMAKADSMVGNWGYNNMCLSLVATFYGYSSSGEVGAQQAAATITAAGQMHTDMSDIPVGALIWYDGTPIGNPYGHVAMYAGNGMVYSNGAPTGVGLIPIDEPAYGWGEPIIGWSSVWLPGATK